MKYLIGFILLVVAILLILAALDWHIPGLGSLFGPDLPVPTVSSNP